MASVPEHSPADPELLYNPLDPGVHADPYPHYRLLRERDPVHVSPFGFWALSRYSDAARVLRDPRFGSGLDEEGLIAMMLGGPGSATVTEFARWMLFRDPPDHTRLRSLVSKAFTPRAVEVFRPRIQQIVDGLIDNVLPTGKMNVIGDLAFPLPVTVISELLGLPIEDQGRCREWTNAIAQALDPVDDPQMRTRADSAVLEMSEYIAGKVAQRRRSLGDDLLSSLITAEEQGARLSEDELVSTVGLLFGAGHETTLNLIGNGLLALLRHPEQLRRLRAEPNLIQSAIEELLRYDSPVQLIGRTARADVEIGGRMIAEGEPVILLVGAANRDPMQFSNPDSLDVARPGVRHLSFGGGIHFCLGAILARTEAQICIATVLRRLPGLELESSRPEWREHITLRGLKSLPVRFRPQAAHPPSAG